MSDTVLRFAPSPTGGFHVGNARTALFNYLYARHYGGRLHLRIEDTDRDRSTRAALTTILEGLDWLGIAFDGEPIIQSHNAGTHRCAVDRLLETGHAYYAYETPEEVRAMQHRAQTEGRRVRYNRDLAPDERAALETEGRPKTVRFRVPEGETVWQDPIRGVQRWDNHEVEDFIILRADGSPIYHLAVVVDDHNIGVTLVMRGAEHLSNTPKQVMLFQALGWSVPTYAHTTLLLGHDGRKLSKRLGATTVTEYRQRGILPEALVNFMALQGWSPGDGREVFTREELVEGFSVEGMLKKNAVFDERKLVWLNGEHVRAKPASELLREAVNRWVGAGWLTAEDAETQQARLLRAVELMQPRIQTVSDFSNYGYFFHDPEVYEEKARKKHWKIDTPSRLAALIERLEALTDFDERAIEGATRTLSGQLGISTGKLIHPTRLVLSGTGTGPGLFEMMAVLGRATCIRRMKTGLKRLGQKETVSQ
jgi:glutamyl-tRNA synthetase